MVVLPTFFSSFIYKISNCPVQELQVLEIIFCYWNQVEFLYNCVFFLWGFVLVLSAKFILKLKFVKVKSTKSNNFSSLQNFLLPTKLSELKIYNLDLAIITYLDLVFILVLQKYIISYLSQKENLKKKISVKKKKSVWVSSRQPQKQTNGKIHYLIHQFAKHNSCALE